jgi:hypothetical protein
LELDCYSEDAKQAVRRQVLGRRAVGEIVSRAVSGQVLGFSWQILWQLARLDIPGAA